MKQLNNFELFPHEVTVADQKSENIVKYGVQTIFKTSSRDTFYTAMRCGLEEILKPETIGVLYKILSNSVSFRPVKKELMNHFTEHCVKKAFKDLKENGLLFSVRLPLPKTAEDKRGSDYLFFVADKPFTKEEMIYCISNIKRKIIAVSSKLEISIDAIKQLQAKAKEQFNTYAFSKLPEYTQYQTAEITKCISLGENDRLSTNKEITNKETTKDNKDIYTSSSCFTETNKTLSVDEEEVVSEKERQEEYDINFDSLLPYGLQDNPTEIHIDDSAELQDAYKRKEIVFEDENNVFDMPEDFDVPEKPAFARKPLEFEFTEEDMTFVRHFEESPYQNKPLNYANKPMKLKDGLRPMPEVTPTDEEVKQFKITYADLTKPEFIPQSETQRSFGAEQQKAVLDAYETFVNGGLMNKWFFYKVLSEIADKIMYDKSINNVYGYVKSTFQNVVQAKNKKDDEKDRRERELREQQQVFIKNQLNKAPAPFYDWLHDESV